METARLVLKRGVRTHRTHARRPADRPEHSVWRIYGGRTTPVGLYAFFNGRKGAMFVRARCAMPLTRVPTCGAGRRSAWIWIPCPDNNNNNVRECARARTACGAGLCCVRVCFVSAVARHDCICLLTVWYIIYDFTLDAFQIF